MYGDRTGDALSMTLTRTRLKFPRGWPTVPRCIAASVCPACQQIQGVGKNVCCFQTTLLNTWRLMLIPEHTAYDKDTHAWVSI